MTEIPAKAGTATLIGAGLIGRAWAMVFARAGWQARLYDRDPQAAAEALERIRAFAPALAEAGEIDDPAAFLDRIAVADSLEAALDGADWVQESIAEAATPKQALFRELDALAAPDTILASSTSAIPASVIAEGLAGRARCLVAHPFNPPHLLPVVEIVPAPFTDPDVTERALETMRAIGQLPVRIKREIPGFVGNRLQVAVTSEAMHLLREEVIEPEDLDTCLRWGLGQRWALMGPLETMDLNAPDGFAGYVARLGPGFETLSKQLGVGGDWDAGTVAKITAARRRALPQDRIGARAAWRDAMLLGLRRFFRGS